MVIKGIGDLSAGNSTICKNSLLKLIANLGTILNKYNRVVLCLFPKRGKEQLYFARKTVSATSHLFPSKTNSFQNSNWQISSP